MVNLLFISNHNKMDILKRSLQPLLKVRIDIVGDFDFGLKDVFEKRPSLVFIQDQIAGVTGESVARHIQMLLGSGAPSFIFMHDGNPKAKKLKGLYDHLIDLSQPDIKVLADVQAAIKSLLGSQWQQVYLPPTVKISDVKPARTETEENRINADNLVDDFISDLGNAVSPPQYTTFPLTDFAVPETRQEETLQIVSSTQDQIAEMLAETARLHKEHESGSTRVHAGEFDGASAPPESDGNLRQYSGTATLSSPLKPASVAAPAAPEKPAATQAASASIAQVQSIAPVSSPVPVAPRVSSGKLPAAPCSPADFRIKKGSPPLEAAPEGILTDFEDNFCSRPKRGKRYLYVLILLILCGGGGGWYLVQQKPNLISLNSKPKPPAEATVPVAPKTAEQVPQKAGQSSLPSFIPLAGHDSSFAANKPGWERYVGAEYECRVFFSAGKLKAVQVLAAKGHEIPESMLKSVLKELTGTSEYRVTTQDQKHGLQILHATVLKKADVMIYRKKTVVQALVVSLD
jgi:hypothetical protein